MLIRRPWKASTLTASDRRKGGQRSAVVRRKMAEAKWATMTPSEIYKAGYGAGYQAALREPIKRSEEVY